MRTEADVVAAIEDLASEAARADELSERFVDRRESSGPRHGRHRSRWAPALAVAACVALVAGVVAVEQATNRHDGSTQPATTSAPTPVDPCGGSAAPKYSAVAMAPLPGVAPGMTWSVSCSGYRIGKVTASDWSALAQVTVYSRGVFDTSLLRSATRVSGSGLSGYLLGAVDGHVNYIDESRVNACEPLTATQAGRRGLDVGCADITRVVWQYAPDSWATVAAYGWTGKANFEKYYGNKGVAKLLRLAAAVRPNTRLPLATPFKMSQAPVGLHVGRLETLSDQYHNGDGGRDQMTFPGWIVSSGGPYIPMASLMLYGDNTGCRTATQCTDAVQVIATKNGSGPQDLLDAPGTRLTIAGHKALLSDQRRIGPTASGTGRWTLTVLYGTWVAQITGPDKSATTLARLKALAPAISFGHSTRNPSTWFNAEQALPR